MALTTLAAVKLYLGVSSSAADARLDALRTVAEQNIKSYCDQNLEEATHTEYHSGSGTRFLVLHERPVLSVTSVHLDSSAYYGSSPSSPFPASTLLTAGEDYALPLDGTYAGNPVSHAGLLLRINTNWQEVERLWRPYRLSNEVGPNFGNVKVVYTAGYDPVPEDLQYAVALLVRYYLNTAPQAGFQLQSEKIGDYSYELAPFFRQAIDNIGSLRNILQRYRDVPV